MSDDFSENQRNIIEKIVKEAIEKTVSRPEDIGGEIRVPDIARTRQIASEEMETWRKAQPPFWDFRKRLDTKLAGAGIAAFLILLVVDAMLKDRDLIIGGFHWVAGTEARIDARVRTMFGDWGNSATSEPSPTIETAFRKRLNAWTGEDSFSNRSRDIFKDMAKADAPELTELVKRALDSQPILMFHAQARLGSVAPVQVESTGCETLVSYWFESQPENLPEGLRPDEDNERLTGVKLFEATTDELARLSAACATQGRMTRDESLGIPFWARFHPDEDDAKDEVYVLIHIQRTLRNVERTEIAPLTHAGQNPAAGRPAQGTVRPPGHPFGTDTKGLRIEYHPSDDRRLRRGVDTVDLTAKLSDRGKGFWFGRIDEHVATATKEPPQGDYAHFELIHSLSISLPDLPQSAGDDYCVKEQNRSTASDPDPACLDEVVQVVAMVMVNKGR